MARRKETTSTSTTAMHGRPQLLPRAAAYSAQRISADAEAARGGGMRCAACLSIGVSRSEDRILWANDSLVAATQGQKPLQ